MKKLFCLILSTVLLCSMGLYAFAADAGFALGDVDGNGKVQSADARLALRASVGLEKYKKGSKAFTAADVDRNDRIGSDDARIILRASVGLEKLNDVNEFDYLRSGNFYIQGTMTYSDGQRLPLEMAVTPDSIYMLSVFEGAAMGMLVRKGVNYMIYPEKKAYLELNESVMKAMGMTKNDIISSADLDYSIYDLAKADSTYTEDVNGVKCTVYVFSNPSGTTRFFINGSKLVRFATYDASGKPDVINDVSYLTDNVPADKIDPPADYAEYKGLTGMFSFISLLEEVVGDE